MEVTNSYVLHCFDFKELFISLQIDVQMRWGLYQNDSILNGQMIYIEKSKFDIADMWLIPLTMSHWMHIKYKTRKYFFSSQ